MGHLKKTCRPVRRKRHAVVSLAKRTDSDLHRHQPAPRHWEQFEADVFDLRREIEASILKDKRMGLTHVPATSQELRCVLSN